MKTASESRRMLTTRERHDSIRRLGDRLDEVVATLAAGPHWPDRSRPSTWYSGSFLQQLLARLVSADSLYAMEELGLLNAYHRDDMTIVEQHEWLRLTAHARGDDYPVPQFLVVACRHDKSSGTAIAESIVEIVEEVGMLVSGADGSVDSRESMLLEGYLSAMRSLVAELASDTT